MHVGPMITNGGPHSPEKWALVTASQIVQIASTATGQAAADGRKLELRIIEILEKAHRQLQDHEQSLNEKLGVELLAQKLDPSVHVEEPAVAIIAAAQDTIYAEHFNKETSAVYLRNVLKQHFGTAMHVSRLWFADKYPDHPNAKIYRQNYQ